LLDYDERWIAAMFEVLDQPLSSVVGIVWKQQYLTKAINKESDKNTFIKIK
jgi:hypothetical protein